MTVDSWELGVDSVNQLTVGSWQLTVDSCELTVDSEFVEGLIVCRNKCGNSQISELVMRIGNWELGIRKFKGKLHLEYF
ncbi:MULTISPECIES: hypothetical protein [unclassified Microcoleus]|uniref:hypothetical protein n=1 Tax=unclassified Microcoleus TaxID=2642155 RepID=UPI0025E9FCA9|nr:MULTISPECIES: hypothetical protein [unclassified Microcoleus]